MTYRKQLVIIPGIGDDHWAYHVGVRRFRAAGFAGHIHVFNWGQPNPDEYDARMIDFDRFITSLPDIPTYLIGVSAGGPVAINAFAAMPDKIAAVATLASPLSAFRGPVNPLLAVAIDRVETNLRHMDSALKARIISIHGSADAIVPTRLSRHAGIQHATIPTFLHPVTILFGLTIYSSSIRHFFKQR